VTYVTFSDDEADVFNAYADVVYRLRNSDGSYPQGLAGYGRGKEQYRMHQNFAEEVHDALLEVGREWARRYPQGPRLVLGEGTIFLGGPHWPHVSHQTGYDVDILVGRTDGKEGLKALNPRTGKLETVTCYLNSKDQGHPVYSFELTKEMIGVISERSPLSIEQVIFADQRVASATRAKFVKLDNHRKHFHVRFQAKSGREQIKIGTWNVPKTAKYGE
jgi:hypothetical protein